LNIRSDSRIVTFFYQLHDVILLHVYCCTTFDATSKSTSPVLYDVPLYDVPPVSSSVGYRASSVAGPQAWNQLPTAICQMDSVATFKCHLKLVFYGSELCV